MSDIVIFNPTTHEVVEKLTSVDASPYTKATNAVVYLDSDVSAVLSIRDLFASVPEKYLIEDNGVIREKTDAEKTKTDILLGPGSQIPFSISTLIFSEKVGNNQITIVKGITTGLHFFSFIQGKSITEDMAPGDSSILLDDGNSLLGISLSMSGELTISNKRSSTDFDVYLKITYQ